MEKKYGFLSSSVDPQSLSLTVKGVLVGIVPTVIFLAPILGLDVDAGELNSLVDSVEQFVFWGATGVSVCATFWGILRKIFKRLGWI